jgi:hypothetical protein
MPIKTFFLSAIIFLMSNILFNYYIDSGNRFYNEKKNSSKIYYDLQNNNILSLNIASNERIFKKQLINYYTDTKTKFDILVCGSSRAGLIDKSVLANESILNVHVNSFTIYDLYSLCLVSVKNFKPKVVILELQPNFFNINNNFLGLADWEVLEEDYSAENYNLKKNILDYKKRKFLELINFQYTKNNLVKIFNWVKKEKENANQYNDDGSYLQKNELINIEHVRAISRNSASNPLFINTKWDEKVELELINFLKIIKKENLKIIFILPPFHPAFFEEIVKKNNFYELSEEKIINIAKKFNIKILGSFKISKTLCREYEYTDSHHPLQSCYKNLLKDRL